MRSAAVVAANAANVLMSPPNLAALCNLEPVHAFGPVLAVTGIVPPGRTVVTLRLRSAAGGRSCIAAARLRPWANSRATRPKQPFVSGTGFALNVAPAADLVTPDARGPPCWSSPSTRLVLQYL